MAQFVYETILSCHPATLYDFLLRPANVARVADPSSGLKIVAGPDVVEVGSRIKIQIVAYGQIQNLIHEIVELSRPGRIVERQVEGPTRSWTHLHLLEPHADGVRMIDQIDFEPPGGVMGFIATASRISDALESNFFARQRELELLVRNGELHP